MPKGFQNDSGKGRTAGHEAPAVNRLNNEIIWNLSATRGKKGYK